MKRTPLVRKTPMRRTGSIGNAWRSLTPQQQAAAARIAQATLGPQILGPELARQAGRALANRQRSIEAGSPDYAGEVETSQRAPKPSNTGFAPATRQIILERDHHACARCGVPIDTSSVGYSLQHRDNRGMGGTTDPAINLPANGLTLCGSGTTGCHGWVEEHPDEAAGNGWAVLAWADPSSVPVRYPHGWYLLGLLGSRQVIAAGIIPDNGAHSIARRKGRS